MKMRTLIFSGLAATMAFTAPVFAFAQGFDADGSVSQECQQSVNNNTLAGGTIGAIAGAVLGKQLAARNARKEGQVLGALVGAVAGSQIGKARLACDDLAYRTTEAEEQPSDYRRNSFNGPFHRERAYPTAYIAPPPVLIQKECGWGEASLRRPDGSFERNSVWMCRENRGPWSIRN
jgi:hypothetical protein